MTGMFHLLLKLSLWLVVLWPFLWAEASGVERNPFAFPTGVQKGVASPIAFPAGVQKGVALPQKEGTGPEKAVKESAPLFRVSTILISGETKVAAINGVLLRKGDELSGYRIVEIEDKQVTLSRGKEKVVVKIDPEEKVYLKKTNSNNRVIGFSK